MKQEDIDNIMTLGFFLTMVITVILSCIYTSEITFMAAGISIIMFRLQTISNKINKLWNKEIL